MPSKESQNNDDSLPSYRRPELLASESLIELVDDVFAQLSDRDRRALYLPKYEDETPEDYAPRLTAAVCPSDLKDAVKGYSALLSQFNVLNPPLSLDRVERDVDRCGATVQSFWQRATNYALRHGGCAIFTDSVALRQPDDDRPLTRAIASTVRSDPFWLLYPRSHVLNWSSTKDEMGQSMLRHVTLLEHVEVDPSQIETAAGTYGVNIRCQYRVLKPGIWELHEIKREDGVLKDLVFDAGELEVDYIPITWFSIEEDAAFGEGDPPLVTLARRCIQEMRQENDLEAYLHTVSHPIPVEVNNPKPEGERRMFGPYIGVSLPENGKFYFAEPAGTSLTQQREHIATVRDKINQSTLSFLHGGSIERTATEASLSAGSVGASLMGLARQLKSSFEEAMTHWRDITGETAGDRTELELSPQTLMQALSPEQCDRLFKALDHKVLSTETVLQELIAGRVVRSGIDPEEELARIRQESRSQMQAPALQPRDFGLPDLPDDEDDTPVPEEEDDVAA